MASEKRATGIEEIVRYSQGMIASLCQPSVLAIWPKSLTVLLLWLFLTTVVQSQRSKGAILDWEEYKKLSQETMTILNNQRTRRTSIEEPRDGS